MTPLLSTALLRAQSDERLLLLVREGQERAFDAIVDRYRKPLQRYCQRALSPPRAEDVVQQVMVKAWLALRDGTDVRSLRPWLYRIARTTMLDNAETPGYDYSELERSLLSPGGPESELEQQTVIRRTLASLAALPDSQREALLRTALEGQSRAQIAEALGVSEGAVRQLVHRARASIRAAATALTPLPLVSWLASTGSSTAGTALENGATGSIGIAGIAKTSALLATAGVVATGSGGVHNDQLDGSKKARAATAKHVIVHRTQARPRALVSATSVVALAQTVARHDAGSSQDGEHGATHARDETGRQGDSRESDRQNGDEEHTAKAPPSQDQSRDEPPSGEQPSGDGGSPPPGDDEQPQPPDSGSPSEPGSGDNGD